MKNYYEILEIDKNASQEVIEKAYKVLIKKYHPDLQTSQEAKMTCEEKIKEINEAYETINNPSLRAEYDNKLSHQNNNNQNPENNSVSESPAKTANTSNSTQENYDFNNNNEELKRQEQYQRQRQQQEQQAQYQEAVQKAYHDAYIQDLKNRGYKIRYKKSLNDYLRSAVALLISIGIIALILQIPVVKNYFYQLYIDNTVIRTFVDTIANIFN